MRIIVLIVACIFSVSCFAQRQFKTSIGFKGGFNHSVIRGYDSYAQKSGFIGNSVYGSLFSEIELNKKWELGTELLFSFTDDNHFIEIPVHFKRKLADKWSFFLGPKLDIIVDNDEDDGYVTRRYKFKTVGVSPEVGIQFNFIKRLFAELRYSRGIMPQIDDYSFDYYEGKRSTFRAGIGVRF